MLPSGVIAEGRPVVSSVRQFHFTTLIRRILFHPQRAQTTIKNKIKWIYCVCPQIVLRDVRRFKLLESSEPLEVQHNTRKRLSIGPYMCGLRDQHCQRIPHPVATFVVRRQKVTTRRKSRLENNI
jgi:hypothetical protein